MNESDHIGASSTPLSKPVTWGRVSAKPSEFLIKLRRGKIVRHGSGLSVFLWPGDTYTIIPTSIQRASFVADQITAEKVGVAVSGIAVYRVADPLLAFRMLDFSADGMGTEVLATTLREMFIGAARRLVASMSVENCLTRRKESIAYELMREIQPVVSGTGRPDDGADRGWGVVIDTIEIQDVRILSEAVFRNLQAPFRAEIALAARQSEVQRTQEVHLKEVEAQHSMLQADKELARKRAEAEEQSRLAALASGDRIQLAEIEGKNRTGEAQLQAELGSRERNRKITDIEHATRSHQAEQRARFEQQQAQQDAEIARQRAEAEANLAHQQLTTRSDLELRETESRLAKEQLETEAALQLSKGRMELDRLRGELETLLRRQSKEVDNLFSEDRIRYELVAHTLPSIAQAFIDSTGEVNVTQIATNSEGQGNTYVAETLAQIFAVAKTAGFDASLLGGKGEH